MVCHVVRVGGYTL
jgi:hypothetical protein